MRPSSHRKDSSHDYLWSNQEPHAPIPSRERARRRANFLAFVLPLAITLALAWYFNFLSVDHILRLLNVHPKEQIAQKTSDPTSESPDNRNVSPKTPEGDATEIANPSEPLDADVSVATADDATADGAVDAQPDDAEATPSDDPAPEKSPEEIDAQLQEQAAKEAAQALELARIEAREQFWFEQALRIDPTFAALQPQREAFSYYQEPQPPQYNLEELRARLAQLQFAYEQLKERDPVDVDAVLLDVDALLAQTQEFADDLPEEIREDVERLLQEEDAFLTLLKTNRDFLLKLKDLDQAALDPVATRDFFEPYLTLASQQDFELSTANVDEKFTDVGENAPSNAEPSQDFARKFQSELVDVARTLEALERFPLWNDFIETNGAPLERFYVARDTAQRTLNFLENYTLAQEVAQPEVDALRKRKPEWTFDLAAEEATQRKIILRLEEETSQKYWCYRPEKDVIYYLPAPPHAGMNNYVANAQGDFKQIEIPENAPDLAPGDSPQKLALLALMTRAEQINDQMRNDDPAKWYQEWLNFLVTLKDSEQIDPVVQFVIFRDVVKILANSDYYLAKRLNPLLKTLNASQFADDANIDRFQSDNTRLQDLRRQARMRLAFLPKDHFTVVKTTAQLDAATARVAFRYERFGWLMQNFNDQWFCRRSDDAPEISGELYVVYYDPTASANQEEFTLKRRKIGSVSQRGVLLYVVGNDIPRGSIVLCRTRVTSNQSEPHASEPEATQDIQKSALERIFRRY
ncbi:MAG: hypothetical protein Q4G03_02610 [Planctomycetia bacterium]|nr:hypothetical protein [Planctomycetia bacterium]